MGATFEELWHYPIGRVPEVDPLLAQSFVRSAWEEIQESKDNWSWLFKSLFITTPDAITAGTVTVTQDSDAAVADATAKTALDAVGSALLIGRQFRVGQGPYYSITAYDSGTGTITLERTYYELTAAGTAYNVSALYFKAPADFKYWLTVVDLVEDFQLDTRTTRQELDQRDPQRSITDSPRALVSYDYDQSDGRVRFEFYPAPQVRRLYPGQYMIKPWVLSAAIGLPQHVPANIMELAVMKQAYEWAEANRGRLKSLQGSDWRYLRDRTDKDYQVQLQKLKRNDENIFLSNFGTNYLNPSLMGRGARYLQSHAPWPAAG